MDQIARLKDSLLLTSEGSKIRKFASTKLQDVFVKIGEGRGNKISTLELNFNQRFVSHCRVTLVVAGCSRL